MPFLARSNLDKLKSYRGNMKPGSIYTHHRSPPLNQLLPSHPAIKNVYIFIKYTDNDLALVYNIYEGKIDYAAARTFEKYFIEAT